MKKRVFSFLLVLALMTAQMQGIAVAAEAPGDAVTEEAPAVEETADEAAVEEAAVEAPVEEAAAGEAAVEAAETKEASAEEKKETAVEAEAALPADDGEAAEAEAPQDPEQDDAVQSFDREDAAEAAEPAAENDEEAPPLETANDPAEAAFTSAEVYIIAPEAGRSAAATDASICVHTLYSAKYRLSSAQWVTDASGKTAFTGKFVQGKTHYVKFVLSTPNGEEFILSNKDVTVNYGTLVSVSCRNEAYGGYADIIASFTPKVGNWLEEIKISVTGPEAGKKSAEVNAADCVKIADGTDVVIDSARWVSNTEIYGYNPVWEGTFNSTDTYYMFVKLVDGSKDRIASTAGGNTFSTELEVSGGTLESGTTGAETISDGKGRCFAEAVISVKAVSADTGYEDVWPDLTEDKSVSIVTGAVHLTGAGGKQAGYDQGKTVYGPETFSVTFSKPKTDEVEKATKTATTTAYELASQLKAKGAGGEFHMSTTESTGKMWDKRKYETTYQVIGPGIKDPIDVEQVGDTDTYKDKKGKTYSVDKYRIRRVHTSSGEYGKETFYKVEANGWVSGHKVTVTDTGYGTAKADIKEGIEGTRVTLTATPDEGYNFYGWQVVSGDVNVSENAFTIGKKDVTVKALFGKKPGKSAKVTVYNVAQGIKVTWLKADGATSYNIYRDDLDGKGYKFLFRTSALEVTDLEVRYELGKKFRYKVLATSKYAGDSDGFRTSTYYRLMPTGITSVTNSGAGKMTATYDKSSGGSGYVVRYGLKQDMSDAKVITVKGENTTSRTFSGLKKGQTYYVQVRTYKIEDGIRYYSGYCLTKKVKIVK